MNIARISTKGQVTLPIDVRHKLNLNEGDHLLISEENRRYYIDNTEHIQSISSGKAFAYTADDLETRLDEADKQATETQIRYSADEVFGRVRRNIRAGAYLIARLRCIMRLELGRRRPRRHIARYQSPSNDTHGRRCRSDPQA